MNFSKSGLLVAVALYALSAEPATAQYGLGATRGTTSGARLPLLITAAVGAYTLFVSVAALHRCVPLKSWEGHMYWQPGSTAPKDGTNILAWIGPADGDPTECVRVIRYMGVQQLVHFYGTSRPDLMQPGWWTEGDMEGPIEGDDFAWAPCPSAPFHD